MAGRGIVHQRHGIRHQRDEGAIHLRQKFIINHERAVINPGPMRHGGSALAIFLLGGFRRKLTGLTPGLPGLLLGVLLHRGDHLGHPLLDSLTCGCTSLMRSCSIRDTSRCACPVRPACREGDSAWRKSCTSTKSRLPSRPFRPRSSGKPVCPCPFPVGCAQRRREQTSAIYGSGPFQTSPIRFRTKARSSRSNPIPAKHWAPRPPSSRCAVLRRGERRSVSPLWHGEKAGGGFCG